MQATKTITIGEHNYIIKQFTAKTGSGIFMLTMKTLGRLMRENSNNEDVDTSDNGDAENRANNAVRMLLMHADEDAFNKIQQQALSVVDREEWVGNTSHPLPVLTYNGHIAIAELEYDTTTVLALTHQVLFFNLAPYFQKKELLQLAMGHLATLKE
jgi:hypothetical protein